MMSAPLILSSDLEKLSPQAVAILSKPAIIAIDQDPLGRMATLVRRSPVMDILFKPLKSGDYAIAVLNRGTKPLPVELAPSDFGFAANAGCGLDAQNLWSGVQQSSAATLQASVTPHDTQIWRIHAAAACGHRHALALSDDLRRKQSRRPIHRSLQSLSGRSRTRPGLCRHWRRKLDGHADGALASGGRCLAVVNGKPAMQACASRRAQHWNTLCQGTWSATNTNVSLAAVGYERAEHGGLRVTTGRNRYGRYRIRTRVHLSPSQFLRR